MQNTEERITRLRNALIDLIGAKNKEQIDLIEEGLGMLPTTKQERDIMENALNALRVEFIEQEYDGK
jgi:aspartate/tyrosine/aromatic aminotransferase